MYGYTTSFGGGTVLAPCGVQFLAEVADVSRDLLPGLTNLGEAGDPRHQAEGTSSDHNGFVSGPSGLHYVRAFDFGGPVEQWGRLIDFWNYMKYAKRDPRVYPYGYTNSNLPAPRGLTIWFGNGATRNGTDGPHAHLSLNRANTNRTGLAAWTPALDDRSPWGLREWLSGKPPHHENLSEDDMTVWIKRLNGHGEVFSGDGVTKRWVRDGAQLANLVSRLNIAGRVDPDTKQPYTQTVEQVGDIEWMGVTVGADPYKA